MDILIVDDDPITRLALCAAVEDWGFTPVLANCGEEALTILDEDNPPHLLVIDWSMPDVAHLLELLAVPREHLEKTLEEDPAGRKLLSDARFQRLMDDPEARKAAQDGDISELMEHPDVRKLLADRSTRERLRSAP